MGMTESKIYEDCFCFDLAVFDGSDAVDSQTSA